MTTEQTHSDTDEAVDEPTYSLSELTDEAGVSVRTVRYYIAEGLLPPPVAAGPRSHYTRTHLDRLRLIERMKSAYLPLKEIRRRLTTLDDGEVRRLAAPSHTSPPRPASPAPARPTDSASSYIARLLHREQPISQSPPVAAMPATSEPLPRRAQIDDDEELESLDLAEPPSPDSYRSPPAVDATATTVPWRRIPLADGAELLIREDAYQRTRDRVDWLIGWARKVFG